MTAAEARERLEDGIKLLQCDDDDLLILRLHYVDRRDRDRVDLDAEVWPVACIGSAFCRPHEVEEHRARICAHIKNSERNFVRCA